MKKILFFFMIMTSVAHAVRFEEESEPKSFTYGGLRLHPGYAYSSLLNSDGARSVFGGLTLAAEFDLVFTIQDLGLGVGPFVNYSYSKQDNLKNTGGYTQELVRTDFMYGIKGFIYPFYVGAAYGDNTSNVSLFNGGSIQNIKLESKVIGFTGGMRLFGLGGDWSVGISGWYKTSFYGRNKNPGLTDNTTMETIEGFITFTLSPLFQVL